MNFLYAVRGLFLLALLGFALWLLWTARSHDAS